jgi:hypothetical protein
MTTKGRMRIRHFAGAQPALDSIAIRYQLPDFIFALAASQSALDDMSLNP